MPRLRIDWLMALVALLAVNFGAIRALMDAHSQFRDLAVVGIVPMLDVLCFASVLFRQGRVHRDFLRRFLTIGACFLALYTAWAALDSGIALRCH